MDTFYGRFKLFQGCKATPRRQEFLVLILLRRKKDWVDLLENITTILLFERNKPIIKILLKDTFKS